MLSGDIPPNQTIYLNNLNEKVKKEELKRSLYALCSQYGRILDVVALKTQKLRGKHGWCLAKLQLLPMLSVDCKTLIYTAKKCEYNMQKQNQIVLQKKMVLMLLRRKGRSKRRKLLRKSDLVEEAQQAGPNASAAQSNGTGYQASRLGKVSQEPPAPPNNILFIQNLPDQTTSMMLQILFQQYPGFREVRMIEAKPGIAFVEFEDDGQSMVAMQALQGFKITPENPMAISYAKK
ncbi:unnamed protein product [Miscanthus lutarioriparius]|uniref:RRM domain-containing protein n=1 Tax=Miscanthus lutarioriparius TaxID=422564 RepID=A0A811MJI6_9POAL|nr:unnamed protein product [Miscanthus lutarioriparius]